MAKLESLTVLSKPLIKAVRQRKTESQLFLFKWRVCEIVSAVFSLLGLVAATVDYEVGYSDRRNHNNCLENEISSELRWTDLTLTVISFVFLVLRHNTKRQWNFEKLRKKLASENKLPPIRMAIFKFVLRLTVESLVLCLFPYPNAVGNVYIDERHLKMGTIRFIRSDVCYTLAEILYALMFLRLFFILRAAINMSSFMDGHSRKICQQYGVKANMRFSLRSMVRANPFWMMVTFVLPTGLFTAMIIRVFERPYVDIGLEDFGSYANTVWFTYVTMTTLGYGDYVTFTELGRFLAVLISVWGLFVFSMMIYVMDNTFQLNKDQETSFRMILQTREAATLIKIFLKYAHQRKVFGPRSPLVVVAYEKVVQQGILYRKRVLRAMHMKALKEKAKKSMLGKLEDVEKMLLTVETKVNTLDRLDQELHALTNMLKTYRIYQYGEVE